MEYIDGFVEEEAIESEVNDFDILVQVYRHIFPNMANFLKK